MENCSFQSNFLLSELHFESRLIQYVHKKVWSKIDLLDLKNLQINCGHECGAIRMSETRLRNKIDEHIFQICNVLRYIMQRVIEKNVNFKNDSRWV